jgi:mRNA interferase MazF
MKRGDLITIAVQGDFGKPRPAVVIQNDLANATPRVLVCPLTSMASDMSALRFAIAPSVQNGLRERSFVMLSNIIAAPRSKCGRVFGSLTHDQMLQINERLVFVLGLAR